MTALRDLLAAAEAAENNQAGESRSVIDNGYTRRDYVRGETETIREPGERLGTCTDGETGEPVDPCQGAGGVLTTQAYHPVTGRHNPAAVEVVTGPTGREVVIEADFEEIETRTLAAMAAGQDVALPGAPPAPAEYEAQHVQSPQAQGAPTYEILELGHSKRRFTYYQVTLADRVERELFNELRAACILSNGWYSRPWAGQPGGFAFREQSRAREFANGHLGGPSGPQGPGPGRDREAEPANLGAQEFCNELTAGPGPVRCYANKLRTLADTMQGDIDHKLGERLENTAKRQGQAARARLEGYQLQRAQSVMRRLAELWDVGQVPASLENVHTKAAIVGHMACALEDVPNGFHAYQVEARPLRPRTEHPAAVALWALYEEDPDAEQAQTLRWALGQVRGRGIPGYFWTEGDARERLHAAAAVEPYHAVLDPSAGDGSLLEGLPRDEDALTMVVEIQPELCDVLKLRGFDARPFDFLTLPSPREPLFDRVIMNPPFEKLQDVAHVCKAWEFLREGGRLVAIMSPAWTFHDTAGARDFRDWVESLGGKWEELPPGSFRHAGTTVNTGVLTLCK